MVCCFSLGYCLLVLYWLVLVLCWIVLFPSVLDNVCWFSTINLQAELERWGIAHLVGKVTTDTAKNMEVVNTFPCIITILTSIKTN